MKLSNLQHLVFEALKCRFLKSLSVRHRLASLHCQKHAARTAQLTAGATKAATVESLQTSLGSLRPSAMSQVVAEIALKGLRSGVSNLTSCYG